MKAKKRLKLIERKLFELSRNMHDHLNWIGAQILDLSEARCNQDKKIMEKCAKIAEDFFEDDVIEGTQIAKEIRKMADASSVSTKSN